MKTGLFNLVLCFVVAIIIAPYIIKLLNKIKFGQSILIYVEKHKSKAGTATMGGIIFVLAVLVGYFVFWSENKTFATITLLSFVFFGVVGFLDDFIKIKYKQNEGLKPYQKIIGQLGIAIIIALYVYNSSLVGSSIIISFSNISFDLGVWIIPFIVFVYLAVVNSVNLIDGLDGLCAGVSSVVVLVLVVILSIVSVGFEGVYLAEITNLNILSLGLVGALLGFLCYNGYPAKVFMGDTGSLAIGGFIASFIVLTRNYLLILIVGLPYVLTALSVIIQVVVYKLTHKRVFKMAPLHHHFEQTCNETKVVLIYILMTIVIGVLAIGLYL